MAYYRVDYLVAKMVVKWAALTDPSKVDSKEQMLGGF